LTGNVQVIELPTDRPRPSIKTVRGGALPFELSPALSKEIKILTVRKRCTLFMTLLAAFKTLLYRYTCQDNITVGTPIGNRSQLDCEKLMGLFITHWFYVQKQVMTHRFRIYWNVFEMYIGSLLDSKC